MRGIGVPKERRAVVIDGIARDSQARLFADHQGVVEAPLRERELGFDSAVTIEQFDGLIRATSWRVTTLWIAALGEAKA